MTVLDCVLVGADPGGLTAATYLARIFRIGLKERTIAANAIGSSLERRLRPSKTDGRPTR
jgi:hypothetical protein